ncbi:MAG: crossover junction endodeoxyribonuclease RuvC [Coriobacteriia bacterium]|nr:crossover junction endodeoxyribonuclease RuvC [Coriobacteriia bacterium]
METVLGIDPGLRYTGWAVVSTAAGKNTPQALAYGVIKTNADDMLNTRLATIYDDLCAVIERYQPTSCALEGVFFGLNAKTALSLGQARGAAILATSKQGLVLGEYPPATIKLCIVGSGQAEKEQVTYMVRQLLGLDHDPKPDHCADALAVALTHLAHGSQHDSVSL